MRIARLMRDNHAIPRKSLEIVTDDAADAG
jgi:hypothetical protein